VKKTAALLALVLLAGCSKAPPPPAPEPAPAPAPKPAEAPKPAKPNMAPPLSDAQKAALKIAFDKARELVKQAQKFKAEGEAIEKAQGREAANNTLVKAKDLFREACELTEDWVEPDLGKVTEGQVKDYLTEYFNERARWQKAMAEMGKLHKD
jgi:hypothetical protein